MPSYKLVCENALDVVQSSAANYLPEKCVMMVHKTSAKSILINNEAWMLQYHKNVEPFFIATNAWSLENHCKASMISALQNKYSIIYGKAFTKIILQTQSL